MGCKKASRRKLVNLVGSFNIQVCRSLRSLAPVVALCPRGALATWAFTVGSCGSCHPNPLARKGKAFVLIPYFSVFFFLIYILFTYIFILFYSPRIGTRSFNLFPIVYVYKKKKKI